MAFTYNRTRRALEHIGDRVVSKVKQELINQNINASRATYNSVRYDIIDNNGQLTMGISSRAKRGYQILDIIDKGRRRGKMPPPEAIELWMADKNIQVRGSKKSAAYLIARKIGWVGIKPKNVFDAALASYKPIMEQIIIDAMGDDLDQFVDENMPKKT